MEREIKKEADNKDEREREKSWKGGMREKEEKGMKEGGRIKER